MTDGKKPEDSSMRHIPPLKTRHLQIDLQELTLGQSIKLAGIPAHRYERGQTELLKMICTVRHGEPDPSLWTVHERIFAVSHYMAAVLEDGPDFSLGESATYTSYLDAAMECDATEREIGDIGGDVWTVRVLRGYQIEAIEALLGELDIPPRLHYLIGGMAAQLVRKDEEPAPEYHSSDYEKWLLKRMAILIDYPASDCEALMGAYLTAVDTLQSYFRIAFSADGVVVNPNEGADGSLPPARFPSLSCVTESARVLAR